MSVPLWTEDKDQIKRCGYIASWDKPEIVMRENIPVLICETNGKRNLQKILMIDSDPALDENWVTVKRKYRKRQQ